jgi:hypothetical protein
MDHVIPPFDDLLEFRVLFSEKGDFGFQGGGSPFLDFQFPAFKADLIKTN